MTEQITTAGMFAVIFGLIEIVKLVMSKKKEQRCYFKTSDHESMIKMHSTVEALADKIDRHSEHAATTAQSNSNDHIRIEGSVTGLTREVNNLRHDIK